MIRNPGCRNNDADIIRCIDGCWDPGINLTRNLPLADIHDAPPNVNSLQERPPEDELRKDNS